MARIIGPEIRPIPPGPDEALPSCRDEFSPLSKYFSLVADKEHGIVQARTAGLGISFVHTHYHTDPGLFGCLAEFPGSFVRN